ncbi:hypothetical protein EBB79_10575 [Parasedimentitalea marina]|uniref:Uncharacterized protein n=1 Tax=Parasedimentitalea marina TaxID=2483033 RepID=A0A3T0N2L9_9RHOB|nr:hypothetical protein EBB79_10575 [Parasedimentitalea marina]
MKRDPAMGEPRKRLTRMRYGVGPMGFLADQIMKELQRAGYPPPRIQSVPNARATGQIPIGGDLAGKGLY